MTNSLKRLALVGIALLTLNGCAASGIVTAMSLSANGVSLVTTGKSITDHVISAALQQDCALLRTLSGEDACHPFETTPGYRDGAVAMAAGTLTGSAPATPGGSPSTTTPAPQARRARTTADANRAPAQSAALPHDDDAFTALHEQDPGKRDLSARDSPHTAVNTTERAIADVDAGPAQTDQAEPLAGLPSPQPGAGSGVESGGFMLADNLPRRYAVIGSFAARDNAERLSASVTRFDAQVVEAATRSGTRYRVIVSPRHGESMDLAALERSGFDGSWALTLCAATLGPPPCMQPELIAGNHL